MGAANPFAELDALRTERNSAVSEAKLWLRRLGAMQRERDQARSNLHAAEKCLGEWQESHAAQRANAHDLYATIERLSDEVFMLQTRAMILEVEALLLRYDVAKALGSSEPA